MIKYRHWLIAFLFEPSLLLRFLSVEFSALLHRTGISTIIYGWKATIMYIRIDFRLARKGYSNQDIYDITDRWRRMEMFKTKRALSECDINLTESIAYMSKDLGVPEYEIREYVERKMINYEGDGKNE
jgi:hypothetical protein